MAYLTTDPLPTGAAMVDGRLRVPLAALAAWADYLMIELSALGDGVKQKRPRHTARAKVKRPKAHTRRWKPGQLKRFRATMAAKRAQHNGAASEPELSPELVRA